MNIRIGIGYDIHRLVKGRRLVLGGVEIPCGKGLIGHSDADVLLHAICDAILGACGEDDIGTYFPDTMPEFKDIASSKLVEEVYKVMKEKKGFKVINIDTVVICDEPKLAKYKEKIREHISGILRIKKDTVNIKAKTTEKTSEDTVSGYAVVLLEKSSGAGAR